MQIVLVGGICFTAVWFLYRNIKKGIQQEGGMLLLQLPRGRMSLPVWGRSEWFIGRKELSWRKGRLNKCCLGKKQG